MDINIVIDLVRMLIYSGLQIVSPALIASLVIAVVIGVIQAVMQIQEQTLSFFPKLLVLFFVFYYMGPWMLEKMLDVMREYLWTIPSALS